jgi:hypothetical protein
MEVSDTESPKGHLTLVVQKYARQLSPPKSLIRSLSTSQPCQPPCRGPSGEFDGSLQLPLGTDDARRGRHKVVPDIVGASVSNPNASLAIQDIPNAVTRLLSA